MAAPITPATGKWQRLLPALSVLLLAAGPALAQPALPYPAVPPPQVERPPPPPSRTVLWEPGHWFWNGVQYVWRPGHYVVRRAYYHAYVPGGWHWRGGAWHWVPAHWR